MSKQKKEQATEVAQTVEAVVKDTTILSKVKLMSDLASACQNPEVVLALKSLPNGEKIYQIFVEAIERELNIVMTGAEKDESSEIALNLIESARSVDRAMAGFEKIIVNFLQSPLLKLLNDINSKLGERGLTAPAQSQVQVPAQPPIRQAQQTQSQPASSPVVPGLGSI